MSIPDYEPLDDEVDLAPWPTLKDLWNAFCMYCSRALAVLQLIFGTALIVIFSSGFHRYEEGDIQNIMVLLVILSGCLIQASAIFVFAGHANGRGRLILIGSIFPCFVCIYCSYVVLGALESVGIRSIYNSNVLAGKSIFYHAMTGWFMALTFAFHTKTAMIITREEQYELEMDQ